MQHRRESLWQEKGNTCSAVGQSERLFSQARATQEPLPHATNLPFSCLIMLVLRVYARLRAHELMILYNLFSIRCQVCTISSVGSDGCFSLQSTWFLERYEMPTMPASPLLSFACPKSRALNVVHIQVIVSLTADPSHFVVRLSIASISRLSFHTLSSPSRRRPHFSQSVCLCHRPLLELSFF